MKCMAHKIESQYICRFESRAQNGTEVKWKLSTLPLLLPLLRLLTIVNEEKKPRMRRWRRQWQWQRQWDTQTGDIIYKWTCLCMRLLRMSAIFLGDITSKFISHHRCVSTSARFHCYFVLICLSNFRAFCFIVFRDELRTRHSGLTTFVDNHATVCVCVCICAIAKEPKRHFQADAKFIFSHKCVCVYV